MNFPQIVLGIAFIIVSVVEKISADDADDLRHAICLKESEIGEDEIDDLMDSLYDDATAVDERFKCYAHCMLERWGHFGEDGKLDVETFNDQNMTDQDMAAVEKCKSEKDNIEDKCEYAFEVTACFMEAFTSSLVEDE
ncbi:general odorant-binding protein 57c-like [Musca domestica]|uniref:General odorant-binding protein 57c-like n=1 Tax=Musca domestica TaxID=7370 RepID=A0A1I8MIM6_MUSDO|nr:general odorant-binding protein 57c-like [Musca domestica]